MKFRTVLFLLCSYVLSCAQSEPSQVLYKNPLNATSGDSAFLFIDDDPGNPLLILGELDGNFVPTNGAFLTKSVAAVKLRAISEDWDSESQFKEPDSGVGVAYTLPATHPNEGDVLTSNSDAELRWAKSIWGTTSTRCYLTDTTFSWFSPEAKYFALQSRLITPDGFRANLVMYDSILGLNIPHTFLGYGRLDDVYFGTSSFAKYEPACSCTRGGADIGYKNQITGTSAHIKMGNNDDAFVNGEYLMLERYSDDSSTRAQYNFDMKGIDMRFNKSFPGERKMFFDLFDTVSNGTMVMNAARDTISLVLTETFGDTTLSLNALSDTLIIPHGLGETPATIVFSYAEAEDDAAVRYSKWYWNSSNIFIVLDGTTLLSSTRINWIAKRRNR
jgi:hypothetical protein